MDDDAALAGCLLRLADDEKLRRVFSANALQKGRPFGLAAMIDLYENDYRGLCCKP